ncbi:MAG TPA: PDZ domain-containing protein [Pyrinomonadaceae bacterium]|nr:PDZ domain-containing protein [Pyrinomonadaceae bacterium]
MNLKKTLYFLASLLLTSGIALAQERAPAPPQPPEAYADALKLQGEGPGNFTFFMEGGSFLGVYAEDINKENMSRYNMREARGVGITQVVKDSPAEKAGLRKDDVIVRFEGENVTSVRKLNRLVSEVAPDQSARLTISRGGSEQEVAVTIGKRNQSSTAFNRLYGPEGIEGLEKLKELHKMFPPGAPGAPPQVFKWEGQEPGNFVFAFGGNRRIGISTTQLTKQLAEYFGIEGGEGVLVTSVTDDSPAAKAGIKAGDVITSVDGEKVESSGDLTRTINKKKEGDVTLTIIRNKNQRNVTVTPMEYKPQIQPGTVPGTRTIVIPRVEIGPTPEVNVVIPAVNIPVMPAINIPIIPEINVRVPSKIKLPKVKIIKVPGENQPI